MGSKKKKGAWFNTVWSQEDRDHVKTHGVNLRKKIPFQAHIDRLAKVERETGVEECKVCKMLAKAIGMSPSGGWKALRKPVQTVLPIPEDAVTTVSSRVEVAELEREFDEDRVRLKIMEVGDLYAGRLSWAVPEFASVFRAAWAQIVVARPVTTLAQWSVMEVLEQLEQLEKACNGKVLGVS
jgi:hypothetical protein